MALIHRQFWTKEYAEGYLACLYDFAHYKDGEMYVGSCGKKYKEIKSEIEAITWPLYEEQINDH